MVTVAGDKGLEASNVLACSQQFWVTAPSPSLCAIPPRCFSARSPFQEAWQGHLEVPGVLVGAREKLAYGFFFFFLNIYLYHFTCVYHFSS